MEFPNLSREQQPGLPLKKGETPPSLSKRFLRHHKTVNEQRLIRVLVCLATRGASPVLPPTYPLHPPAGTPSSASCAVCFLSSSDQHAALADLLAPPLFP